MYVQPHSHLFYVYVCVSCRYLACAAAQGCTQMFCTNPECHTLFDYRTLRILCERDHVHNPHYTEWLAQRRASAKLYSKEKKTILQVFKTQTAPHYR